MPDPISWSHAAPWLGAALAFGYLLGSIPFGLIFARLAGLGDIRKIGSGNIGATNALRLGGRKLGAATLLADGSKGAVAVLAGANWGPDMAVAAGFGALIGHLFPVWLRFTGGKGVATFLGIVLAAHWPSGLAALAAWLVAAAITRMSSVGALVATLAATAALMFFLEAQWAEVAAAMTVLIWIKHHANIRRLVRGQEPRIGGRSRPA